jgi:hypothetical protein
MPGQSGPLIEGIGFAWIRLKTTMARQSPLFEVERTELTLSRRTGSSLLPKPVHDPGEHDSRTMSGGANHPTLPIASFWRAVWQSGQPAGVRWGAQAVSISCEFDATAAEFFPVPWRVPPFAFAF